MADETSPCGLVRVEWQYSTGLMSHEINAPRFIDARTGAPFLTLWDEQWDANVRWDGEGRFCFSLRNYGRPGNLEAEVDVVAHTLRLVVPAGRTEPLDTADRIVRAGFIQLENEARRADPRRPAAPVRWSRTGVVFIALMAALLAIVFYRFG